MNSVQLFETQPIFSGSKVMSISTLEHYQNLSLGPVYQNLFNVQTDII